MNAETAQEIAALKKLATKELRRKYAEVFGDATNANNKAWLLKRIAWRLQANAEGGLTERAKKRAAELANDADLRLTLPKAAKVATEALVATAPAPATRDDRLPPAGAVLVREYRGGKVQVFAAPSRADDSKPQIAAFWVGFVSESTKKPTPVWKAECWTPVTVDVEAGSEAIGGEGAVVAAVFSGPQPHREDVVQGEDGVAKGSGANGGLAVGRNRLGAGAGNRRRLPRLLRFMRNT